MRIPPCGPSARARKSHRALLETSVAPLKKILPHSGLEYQILRSEPPTTFPNLT